MRATDGETFGADHSFGLALGVDADKSRRLFMEMTVIGFDEFLEGFGELVSL